MVLNVVVLCVCTIVFLFCRSPNVLNSVRSVPRPLLTPPFPRFAIFCLCDMCTTNRYTRHLVPYVFPPA